MTNALIATLRSISKGMTPALSKIAETVLSNPEATLYQSITELAENSGSSEASVMRFCRDQGFKGFQDFKLTLAKELATDEFNRESEIPSDDVGKLVETAIIALRETEQLIDRKDIARAASKLMSADQINCFGVAASGITTQYMAYKMVRLGLRCRVQSDAHLALMVASTANKKDVFVVTSSSGSTIDAVQVAEAAHARGAFVIAISNRGKSPLVGASSLALIASWPETPLTGGAFPSKISQLLIVDALAAELIRKNPTCGDMARATAESVSDRSY